MMKVPDDIRETVELVDDNMTAIDNKISNLPKSRQIELWQYLAHIAKSRYKMLRTQNIETSKDDKLTGEKTISKVINPCSQGNAEKKRYSAEWWRSYDKLTTDQMRQILRDKLEILPSEHRRGLSTDRKEALQDKISHLRRILKKRARESKLQLLPFNSDDQNRRCS